jgi:hypothetical protein
MTDPREEAREEIEALARRVGAPIRRRDHRHPAATVAFTHVVRFGHLGHRIAWSANDSQFLIEVEQPSGLVFAAGQPDLVVGAARPAGVIGGVAVFETATGDGAPLRAWIDAHGAKLPALGLRGTEQLLIATNRTTLIVEPGGLEQDLRRLDALCALATTLPGAGTGKAVDAADLPTTLEPLRSLLEQWAIDDDEQRSLAIEHASDSELEELWRAVGPKLGAIDAALEHGDASSAPLGGVAQAALEAEREMQRRAAS